MGVHSHRVAFQFGKRGYTLSFLGPHPEPYRPPAGICQSGRSSFDEPYDRWTVPLGFGVCTATVPEDPELLHRLADRHGLADLLMWCRFLNGMSQSWW